MERLSRSSMAGWLVTLLLGVAAPAGAQCIHCGAGAWCDPGGFFLFCRAGISMSIPYCTAFMPCSGNSGGGGDPMPVKRPVILPRQATGSGGGAAGVEEAGATVADDDTPSGGRLSLYSMHVPVPEGLDAFLPAGTSWVEHGVRDVRTGDAMLGALAQRLGVTVERLSAIDQSVSLGPVAFTAALVDPAGDGYRLSVQTTTVSTRIRLCAVRGRLLAGALADATLAEGDLLCVRIHLQGRDQIVTFAARLVPEGDPDAFETARQERARFLQEARTLTARATGVAAPLEPLVTPPDECR